ncbi:MAG: hypothetical protein ACJ8F7_20350, partial [Gemmataceae bacterium]
MKTLAELQAECAALSIAVTTGRRPSKEAYTAALRQHRWEREHPGEALPEQTLPMLLSDWQDLAPAEAEAIETDQHAWSDAWVCSCSCN